GWPRDWSSDVCSSDLPRGLARGYRRASARKRTTDYGLRLRLGRRQKPAVNAGWTPTELSLVPPVMTAFLPCWATITKPFRKVRGDRKSVVEGRRVLWG